MRLQHYFIFNFIFCHIVKLHIVGELFINMWCHGIAWAHSIHGDIVFPKLKGGDFCKAYDSMLSCNVSTVMS